ARLLAVWLQEVSLGADVGCGEGHVVGEGLLKTEAPVDEFRCAVAIAGIAVGYGLRSGAAGVVAGAVGGGDERGRRIGRNAVLKVEGRNRSVGGAVAGTGCEAEL